MGRRPRGTGSIYQRSNGSWVAQYHGQYRYAKTEKQAKAKLTEMLRSDAPVKPKAKTTVSDALDGYMGHAAPNLKPRSITRYQVAIEKHLRPAIGKKRLHALTVLDIEQLYSEMLANGSSPASVRLTHAVLISSVKRCVRLGLVQTNVCGLVKLPKQRRKQIEVYSDDEVRRILDAATGNPLYALYRLLLDTGLRTGEAFALTENDYDGVRLRIDKTLYEGVVGTCKSDNSVRTIVLPKQTRAALDGHTAGTRRLFEVNGRPINNHFPRDHWYPMLDKAGVPRRNPHVARHTVATKLLHKGIAAPTVAAYLGHDVATLMRTYAHCMPDSMALVAAAMA